MAVTLYRQVEKGKARRYKKLTSDLPHRKLLDLFRRSLRRDSAR